MMCRGSISCVETAVYLPRGPIRKVSRPSSEDKAVLMARILAKTKKKIQELQQGHHLSYV